MSAHHSSCDYASVEEFADAMNDSTSMDRTPRRRRPRTIRMAVGFVCALLAWQVPYRDAPASTIALPGNSASVAATAGQKIPKNAPFSLSVTGKTATSVSLAWNKKELRKWGVQTVVVFRNGLQLGTIEGAKGTFVDRTAQWGTTYRYFFRGSNIAGRTKDSSTVWVTTDALTTGLNIVLILTDDQRWDTLQYMPMTRQLLAAAGVTFSNAFAATPQCCPSRAGILTGLHSHNHGVLSNEIAAPGFKDASTIATWLRGAGYRTALIGKYLNGYPGLKPWPYIPPGWSEWHVFKGEGYYNYTLVENGSEVTYGNAAEEYSTLVLANKATDFIRTTAAGQPFLLVFAPYAPHRPAAGAREDRGLFSDLAPWRPPSFDEADVTDKPTWVRELGPLTAAELIHVQSLRRDQLRSLQAVDRAVKSIVETLAATGKLDNTVILFTSDNGFAWGEHRWDAKMCVYEECIRVPLIIRMPGVSPRREEGLVTLIDLAPSFAAWAGVMHPKVDGLSLARLLATPQAWRNDVLIEMLGGERPMLYSAIRTARYTYAEYVNGDRELYDLAVDPHQLMNVAADPRYASVVEELRARLAVLKAQ
jgi:N-acetylglucosamine-6-sulfatase